jgi:hypothetical protein
METSTDYFSSRFVTVNAVHIFQTEGNNYFSSYSTQYKEAKAV